MKQHDDRRARPVRRSACSALFIVNALFVWLRHYSLCWLGERVVTDLRGLVFDRLLTLPLAWFHERRSGELVGRLASDVTVIEGVVGSELSIAMRNGVQIIGALVLLFVIDVKLTLLMLGIVPPIVLTTICFGRKIRAMSRGVQDELAKVSGQVQESVGAIATVQSFVREALRGAALPRRRRGRVPQDARAWCAGARRSSRPSMSAGYAGVAAVIWLGGRALIHNELTAGRPDLVLPLHVHRRGRARRSRERCGRACSARPAPPIACSP